MEQTATAIKQGVANTLFQGAAQFANVRGKKLFGEHFALTDTMQYSDTVGTLLGDLDAVIPFTALSKPTVSGNARAFFLQQGVTRSTDTHGLVRNDTRIGVVYRFNASNAANNIIGLSSFLQENKQHGHRRIVIGVDYQGIWGRADLNYFKPTTDWRQSINRANTQERASGQSGICTLG